jgi:hypothetical protein
MSTENPVLDKVLLLMVSGLSHADLTAVCVSKLGVPPERVADIIAQTRRKLTLAADYNRDEQIGTAVTRLNDIYSRAIREQDTKVCLAAQKELNKLLDLYRMTAEHADYGSGNDEADSETAAVAAHLLPLKLVPETHPLREHARVAAEMVRQHLAATAAPPEPAPAEPAASRLRRR